MKYFILFISFFFLVSCAEPKANTCPNPLLKTQQIVVENISLRVEVAETSAEKSCGMGFRKEFLSDGMLFLFSEKSMPTFWMKDTLIPLDMVWINDNEVLDIMENISPEPETKDEDLKQYIPKSLVNKVLELPAGSVAKYKIRLGSTIYGLDKPIQ